MDPAKLRRFLQGADATKLGCLETALGVWGVGPELPGHTESAPHWSLIPSTCSSAVFLC
jgi:hypothetical protein